MPKIYSMSGNQSCKFLSQVVYWTKNVKKVVSPMSRADELYKQTCRKILEEGFSDEGQPVRPHWPDGTPAHTLKTFGVVNR